MFQVGHFQTGCVVILAVTTYWGGSVRPFGTCATGQGKSYKTRQVVPNAVGRRGCGQRLKVIRVRRGRGRHAGIIHLPKLVLRGVTVAPRCSRAATYAISGPLPSFCSPENWVLTRPNAIRNETVMRPRSWT